jgi:hypothetical protein
MYMCNIAHERSLKTSLPFPRSDDDLRKEMVPDVDWQGPMICIPAHKWQVLPGHREAGRLSHRPTRVVIVHAADRTLRSRGRNPARRVDVAKESI